MGKWEMVRLGDVCEIVSGTTPKSNIEEYWNGTQNWVTPAELREDTLEVFETHRKITERAIKESSLKPFPAGTVLLSSRAPIGKVAIAGTEMYCNQGFKNLVCSERIINKYLYWFLKGKTDYLNLLGRGATFKEISKSIVLAIEIPLPPLDEQKRIAKNLDLASEIVKGYKEQLAELGKLEQSVFYEMFGDPVTNEKKLPIIKLGNLAQLKAGKNVKGNELFEQDEVNKYPCYGGNGIRGYINKVSHRGRFCLIGRQGALCGNVQLAKDEFFATEHAVVVVPIIETISLFLYYVLKLINLNRLQTGAAQPGLNIEILNNVDIPLPHLSLQARFAEIVTAIEAQKSQVQQALAEAENLFNSLMQEYFA